MRNSEKRSRFPRILGVVLKVIVFCLFFTGVTQGINYLVFPATSYTRIQFHDLYEKYDEENIDLLFLGTSHAYRGFDCRIFDEALNMESYNFGTSMQTVSASYYLLKEILKTNTPKTVVFELTYSCFNIKDRNPKKNVIISQYMKPSLNKLEFLMNEYELEDIFYGLYPAYAFRENLKAETLGETLQKKMSPEYLAYDPAATVSKTEWMEYKGFVYTDKALSRYGIGRMDPDPFVESNLDPKYLEALYKIIYLCRQKGVEIVFVTMPSPKASLLELGNYDQVCDYMNGIAEKHQIPYYNFNLLREDVLKLENLDFYDSHHVNGEGARKVSEVFAQILKEKEAGTLNLQDYFYDNWSDVLATITDVEHAYMSVTADEENYYLTGHAYSGVENAEYEYAFWLIDETDGSYKKLRGWSKVPFYAMPKDFRDETWAVRMTVRLKGSKTPKEECQRHLLHFPREVEQAE